MRARRRGGTLDLPRGQALAEFALVLPLILFFIAGVVEMGRAWNIKQAVTDAAREGARYTVVKDAAVPTVADVEAKIQERLALAGITTSTITVSSADPDCATVSDCFHNDFGYGKEMTVNVATQFKMALMGTLLRWAGVPASVEISTTATMRNE